MTPPSRFHRAERLSDAALHVLGLILALGAVPFLVWLSIARRGDMASVAAIAVYGVSLIAMLTCSAIYNMTVPGRWTPVYKRLDHSAIYLKIAGSYTPLVTLTGAGGLPFLLGLWIAAIGGSSLKIAAPNRLRWLGLLLYMAMGWVGAFFGQEILAALTPEARKLVYVAGALYTFGLPFFLWTSLPFQRTIWHAFVFVASGVLYAAMCVEVMRTIEESPLPT
jgi:hemolysin III